MEATIILLIVLFIVIIFGVAMGRALYCISRWIRNDDTRKVFIFTCYAMFSLIKIYSVVLFVQSRNISGILGGLGHIIIGILLLIFGISMVLAFTIRVIKNRER